MTIEAADPWLIAAELWDAGTNTESWAKQARPDQLAPAGDEWDVWLILAGRGFGKMLRADTPIPTPAGWAALDALEVGDEVFDEAGPLLRVGGAQGLRNHHRMITHVEPIDPTLMRCLTVDSPNSMYLAGEGMIPTHNTRSMMEDAAEQGRHYPGARIALVAATRADARDTLVEGESGLLTGFGSPMVRPAVHRPAWHVAVDG